MDPLADVMDVSRVRGAMLANVRACAPWGLALPQSAGASFHALTSGTAWLRVEGAAALQLMPGDLLLLPTGIAAPALLDAGRPLPAVRPHGQGAADDRGRRSAARRTGRGDDVRVRRLRLRPRRGAVAALAPAGRSSTCPPTRWPGRRSRRWSSLLAGELGTRDAGARAAVARLIDLLLIHAVRAWSASADGEPPSWLRALHDPVVARALAALHARPDEPWTIESLAAEVHLSRATLARRFTELVGEPPLTYLTRWRMDLAARRLKDTTDPVETIARGVGYTSEYAFNRAFSRHRGQPPGRYRRAA